MSDIVSFDGSASVQLMMSDKSALRFDGSFVRRARRLTSGHLLALGQQLCVHLEQVLSTLVHPSDNRVVLRGIPKVGVPDVIAAAVEKHGI